MRDESEAALQVAWEAWHADNDDTLCFPGFVFRAAFKAGWAAHTPVPDVARLLAAAKEAFGLIREFEAGEQSWDPVGVRAGQLHGISLRLESAIAEHEAAQSARSI